MNVEHAPSHLFTPIGSGLLGERPGYNYDFAPPDAVLKRFSVRDGRIVLPDGMSYRVLTLPNLETMTPALSRKIRRLISDGATVIGPKPLKSPSLSGYPLCDAEVRSMGDQVWGDCDGRKVKEHAYGKGRVIWGKTAEEVLREMNIPPDFTYSDSHGGPTLLYAHHSLGERDIYFVANKQQKAVAGTARFRIAGRQPEFWWPETGRTEPVAVYKQENGVTLIPMQLECKRICLRALPALPGKSQPYLRGRAGWRYNYSRTRDRPGLPQMIRRPGPRRGLNRTRGAICGCKSGKQVIMRSKLPPAKAARCRFRRSPSLEIPGPWQAAFPFPNGDITFEKLRSWSDSSQSAVKYFSGTAIYHKSFQLPPS